MVIGASTGLGLQCPLPATMVTELAPHRAKFSLKPLERGFGTTLGTVLSRALLLPWPPCAPNEPRRGAGEAVTCEPATALDATFPPVLQVAVAVAPTRCAQRTDLDELVLDVATDGSIAPVEAMARAAGRLVTALEPFAARDDSPAGNSPPPDLRPRPGSSIEALGLSLRTTRCLKDEYIWYIGDLIQRTETDLLRSPRLGRKNVNEIKAALIERGLTLAARLKNWPPPSHRERQ